ncbi:hypothetical protein SPRG_21481 [Saprolegnia parasitica CBS 223.65]|uniref:Serine-threonine/tyrosine-protein kinase catalytic domain-containing protein n=1 Tax=Saprolegnia parasitica (strain CBS 223.65) TaxID=695850 RepID=A0A067BZ11_SAPPC|nr:hypothetical protein SPRG_21481 [Saprolegnia parasitica CBS 223.65]KDO19797.1 hypothetical protein SPRG_21481 [Saprolegnia parasitica CBS 223.65]|eukprot:XP_012209514.1 hypothetical protein SPRG_21481 [Saprolegnia parasitica CBS 223.65]
MACKYDDLRDDETILTNDGSCAAACVLGRNCSVVETLPANATRFDFAAGYLLGDLSRHTPANLTLVNVQERHLAHKYRQLPADLRSLWLDSHTLDTLYNVPVPRGLERLMLSNSTKTVTLYPLRMRRLRDLFIANGSVSLDNAFPPTLTYLHLDLVSDLYFYKRDLSSLERLELYGVTKLEEWRLSNRLQHFTCPNCNITAAHLDTTSFRALQRLHPTSSFRVPRLESGLCVGENLRVMPLWDAYPQYTACVISDEISYRSHLQLWELNIYLIIAGSLLVIASIISCLYYTSKICATTRRSSDDDYLASTLRPNEMATLHMLQIDADAIVLCGTKPLASGAYGDVWRGVILSEMSTHKVPYSDALNASSGRALSQQAILSKVTSGALRPTFAAAAPHWLLEVGSRCLSLDPTQRPTTLELTVLVRDFGIAVAEYDQCE